MSQPVGTSQQTNGPVGSSGPQLVLPSDKTLQQACKLSLKTKKPICFYFYIDSLKNVYKTEDILNGIPDPKIIAQYVKNNGVCSIPEFGI